MRIDSSVPGYCECHRPYEPAPRGPYPYLTETETEALPVTGGRPCRILPPLPIPDSFRNGLATVDTPSVINAGSDLRTTQRRLRQREADAEARRSRDWQRPGALSGRARRTAQARAGVAFAR